MEVEIIEKKENNLLRRVEVRFKVAFDGATPSRQDIKKRVVALLNSDKELTVLDSIVSHYGSQTAEGYVKVYADGKAMSVEPEHMLKRNAAKDETVSEGEGTKAEGEPSESAKSSEAEEVKVEKTQDAAESDASGGEK
jgi:small subunit ribosomal protein S24e